MCFVTNHFNSTDINDSYSRICGGEKLKIFISTKFLFCTITGQKLKVINCDQWSTNSLEERTTVSSNSW